jgi:hypothetical protein
MLRSAEHLVHKHGIRLFLWEKHRTEGVHGLGHMALIERNRHLLTHALLTLLEAPRPAW